MLPEIDALPGPEGKSTLENGNRERRSRQGGFDMRGHIVGPLLGMSVEAISLWNETIQPALQVLACRRVSVFLNEQTGGRMLNEKRAQPFGVLGSRNEFGDAFSELE